MNYSPERVAELTGLLAGQIIKAARTYAKAKAAAIFCMGITQHTVGSDNVAACANLALLTGNIGKRGAGVMPLRGQNNVQGACDISMLPGYAAVIDDDIRSQIAAPWGGTNLPAEQGLTVVVTHHAPSIQSIVDRYRADPVSAAFASNMDDFILEHQPRLWIHGHTHESFDYEIGKNRVVCNPRGYASTEENKGFRPDYTLEV